MKSYKEKIERYKDLTQNSYIRESAIQEVVCQCAKVEISKERIHSSYFEFLYEQCRFIKKEWWILQGSTLLLLWALLNNNESLSSTGRIIGIFSVLFSVLIIPEIWKNRRFSAVEIEQAAYYSLRQICSARLLLFAMIDMLMVTVFFIITFNTLQISIGSIITNFLVPFNISSGICFHLLYSKGSNKEYVVLCLSIVLVIIWSVVVTNDAIYSAIVEPIWLGLVFVSFGYLVFSVRKSQRDCELVWEAKTGGIRA